MSFSFAKTYATRADAEALLENEHIPDSVRAFIVQALAGIPDAIPVEIAATGHLYENNSYNVSNAAIRVSPLVLYRASKLTPEEILANPGCCDGA